MMKKFEIDFMVWINKFNSLEGFFVLLSSKYFSLVLLILFAIYMFKIKKIKTFLYISLATGVGDVVGNNLKKFFAEPRPCYEYGELLISLDIISAACGTPLTGMPSNHTLNYFLFSSLVILVLKNKFIGVFFLVVSFLVGISRIYLAKHLLSQVIMGGLVGIILGIAFYLIHKTWNQRQTSQ